jgi:hypothetical protein
MRYDEEKGIYRDCKFCSGRGCISCKSEADKDYRSQFPEGPQPIATFDTKKPEDMTELKKYFSARTL